MAWWQFPTSSKKKWNRVVAGSCPTSLPAEAFVEPLEARRLCSATIHSQSDLGSPALNSNSVVAAAKRVRRPRRLAIPANVNISRLSQNQSEGAITVDPTNSQRLFAASNMEANGLFTAVSTDGGNSWSRQVIADGSDGLPPACCDPSVAFDNFGNLYLSYIDSTTNNVRILMSSDGGFDFTPVATFHGAVDQPTITAANSMVWITFQDGGRIVASGAPVNGVGDLGPFSPLQTVPNSFGGNFGDIAIGPSGQVMVTYMSPSTTRGPSSIFTSVDPNGLGGQGFSQPVLAARTSVGGFRAVPPQSSGTIDAEAGLAYDRSGGAANGRVYLVYTDASSSSTNNTFVAVRFSNNNGASWSNPIRVNDSRVSNTQFLPRIALDQSTGNVGLSWYDTRSVGATSARLYGAIGRPTSSGVSFSSNFQISRGISNAGAASNGIDYGDYVGLAFGGGVMHPIWSDNSNSTGDNPDGSLSTFDQYTARIPVA